MKIEHSEKEATHPEMLPGWTEQNSQSIIAIGSTMQMDAKGKIASSNMTNGSRKRKWRT